MKEVDIEDYVPCDLELLMVEILKGLIIPDLPIYEPIKKPCANKAKK